VATAATSMAMHMPTMDGCGRSFSLPAIPDQGVEFTHLRITHFQIHGHGLRTCHLTFTELRAVTS